MALESILVPLALILVKAYRGMRTWVITSSTSICHADTGVLRPIALFSLASNYFVP